MTGFTALLDANILYPAPMRDIFLQLAADDVFRAKWTADIHREWIDALIRNEPHVIEQPWNGRAISWTRQHGIA